MAVALADLRQDLRILPLSTTTEEWEGEVEDLGFQYRIRSHLLSLSAVIPLSFYEATEEHLRDEIRMEYFPLDLRVDLRTLQRKGCKVFLSNTRLEALVIVERKRSRSYAWRVEVNSTSQGRLFLLHNPYHPDYDRDYESAINDGGGLRLH